MTPPMISTSPMDRRPSLGLGLTALHVGTPGSSSAYSSPASFHHSSHSRQSSEASFHGASPAFSASRRMSNALDTLHAAANVPLPPSPLVIPSAPPMGFGFGAAQPSYSYQPLSYTQQPYSDVRMPDGAAFKAESP